MRERPPLVLSIQSHVAYGHVGNAAAVLPMQLLGVQPLPVHTVQFSNHTGYGEFKGQVFGAEHIRDVIEGLRARGVLARVDAVLSGYLGDAAIGEVILDAVEELRAARPGLVYLCDPVMGDVGRGVFVRPAIPDFLRRRALARADIVTPNQFEFELLCGRAAGSLEDAVDMARALLRTHEDEGPRLVVVTSLRTPDLSPASLTTLAVDVDSAWTVQTPFVDLSPLPNGMGDVFSAVLLSWLLRGEPAPEALARTVSALYGLIRRMPAGDRDLPLVQARGEIPGPSERFEAVRLA
ncbi:pyridoxal kinase PdxY [Coralloluteibacterium thermophilus]|uniref:pyridoxal kinase n=1 Tax=Coralloluteibacterium thermophilum TaxID=2707049 RepID=A0ABV9NPS1_9GAMM